MLHRMIHHHLTVVRVELDVVGPTSIDVKRAQAKRTLEERCIPAWEPFGFFPDGTRSGYLGEEVEGV